MRPAIMTGIAPSPTTEPVRRAYLPALDGIRALAVLAVFAFHCEE
jgi:peptidoglycan/LPS O-acetylase OafA/YrhL